MEKPKYVVFDKTEKVLESWGKDFFTLVMISFCVYISQNSTWWTFVTGLMFIFFVGIKITNVYSKRYKPFKTKAELLEWVNSLED